MAPRVEGGNPTRRQTASPSGNRLSISSPTQWEKPHVHHANGAAIPRDPTESVIDTIRRREGRPRHTGRPSDLAARPVLKVDGGDAVGLWRAVFAQRMRFYGQLITGDARKRGRTEDDALNAAGWLNRLAEFMEV